MAVTEEKKPSVFHKIRHAYRVAKSLLRERRKRTARSPHWDEVQHAYVKEHPSCAACGGSTRLQVHHRKPFHLFPALELDPSNLIGLCMGAFECHIRIGHGDDFKAFNPDVALDSQTVRLAPDQRPKVEALAKAKRLYEARGPLPTPPVV